MIRATHIFTFITLLCTVFEAQAQSLTFSYGDMPIPDTAEIWDGSEWLLMDVWDNEGGWGASRENVNYNHGGNVYVRLNSNDDYITTWSGVPDPPNVDFATFNGTWAGGGSFYYVYSATDGEFTDSGTWGFALASEVPGYTPSGGGGESPPPGTISTFVNFNDLIDAVRELMFHEKVEFFVAVFGIMFVWLMIKLLRRSAADAR